MKFDNQYFPEYVKGYVNGVYKVMKSADLPSNEQITKIEPATEEEYLEYIADITSNL